MKSKSNIVNLNEKPKKKISDYISDSVPFFVFLIVVCISILAVVLCLGPISLNLDSSSNSTQLLESGNQSPGIVYVGNTIGLFPIWVSGLGIIICLVMLGKLGYYLFYRTREEL